MLALALSLLAMTAIDEAHAGQVRLQWEPSGSSELGFVIERRPATTAAFQEIASVGAAVNAFDDLTVDPGDEYCYQVRAFGVEGLSDPSNEACGAGRPFEELPRLVLDVFLRPGQWITMTGTLTPGVHHTAVDAYIVLQLPDQSLFSFQLDGRFVPGIVPVASNFAPSPLTGELLRYVFDGNEPAGRYTLFAALVSAATLDVIGKIEARSFDLGP